MRKILIDNIERDVKNLSYGLPWKYDATCFNFRKADEFLYASEIDSITDKTDIEVLIIGGDLEDYSFISDMTNLKQLYIYSGQNITKVDFVKNLVNLSQLFIADSKVESVDGLVEMLKEQKRRWDEQVGSEERFLMPIRAICIETESEKVSKEALEEPGLYLAEVIIKPPAK